jgi:hypothetical protein
MLARKFLVEQIKLRLFSRSGFLGRCRNFLIIKIYDANFLYKSGAISAPLDSKRCLPLSEDFLALLRFGPTKLNWT